MTGPAKPQINFSSIFLQNVNSKIPLPPYPNDEGFLQVAVAFVFVLQEACRLKKIVAHYQEIFCDAETKDVHRITSSLFPSSPHQTLNETGAGNGNLLSRVDFPTPKGTNYLC